MVEIEKKYQIGVRRFGLINWVGAYKSIWLKEVNRFLIVWAQTLTCHLWFQVYYFYQSFLWHWVILEGMYWEFPFISFLAPGLIAMSVLFNRGFLILFHLLMIGKIQGNIIDTLMAPLSATEVTFSYNTCCSYKKYDYWY